MRVTVKGLDEDIHAFERAGDEMPEGCLKEVKDSLQNIKSGMEAGMDGQIPSCPAHP